jgi:hypothetical protein
LLSDTKPIVTFSKLENWTENDSINRVISLIEENLELFKQKYANPKIESDLNQNFALCMNSRAKDELFGFSNEYKDIIKATPHKVDFGIVPDGETDAFFVIEAKRLDKNIEKKDKKRKKEYIIGKLGGIERFKNQKHGGDLTHVGMIGYVQTDNFDTWFTKINSWIDEEIKIPTSIELIWKKQDKLKPNTTSKLFNTYLSKHQCKTKNLSIYHIWIDLI